MSSTLSNNQFFAGAKGMCAIGTKSLGRASAGRQGSFGFRGMPGGGIGEARPHANGTQRPFFAAIFFFEQFFLLCFFRTFLFRKRPSFAAIFGFPNGSFCSVKNISLSKNSTFADPRISGSATHFPTPYGDRWTRSGLGPKQARFFFSRSGCPLSSGYALRRLRQTSCNL